MRALSSAWVLRLDEGVWARPLKSNCSLSQDPRKFIDDPDKLANFIKGHQLWGHPHNHSAYCKRYTEGGQDYCRFTFPRDGTLPPYPNLPADCQLLIVRRKNKQDKPVGSGLATTDWQLTGFDHAVTHLKQNVCFLLFTISRRLFRC